MTADANTGESVISAEYDLPWYIVCEPENLKTDEEQLKDMLYRYCAAYDFASLLLDKELIAQDAIYRTDHEELHGARNIIGFLKMKRKTRSRNHHSVEIEGIDVNGDHAIVKAVRIAPDL